MCDIETATTLERSGDLVGALQIYRKLYAQNSNDESAILGIAQCAMALEKPEIAFEFYLKLLIVNHQNPYGYLGRAQVMFIYGQDNRALGDLARAIELDNPASDMRIDCASILNGYGYPDMAYEVLKPILGVCRENDDFQCEWLYSSIAKGIVDDELIKMLGEFSENWPDDPFVELCQLMLRLKENGDEAIKDELRELLERAPELEGKIEYLL